MTSADNTIQKKNLSLKKKLLFSCISVIAFFGLLEALLIIIGYENDITPMTVEQIANKDLRKVRMTEDADMFWKLDGKDEPTVFRFEKYAPAQPSRLLQNAPKPGLPDRNKKRGISTVLMPQVDSFVFESAPEKPPAEKKRLIALGDSCTFFGEPSYPKRLEILLNSNAETQWEVLNAGVPAYSSYQGRVYLNKVLSRYNPHIITLFFGWNDHWKAQFAPDKVSAEMKKSACIRNILLKSRFLGLLESFLRKFSSPGEHSSGSFDFRVSPDDYAENLQTMIETAGKIDAVPFLCTAPYGFTSDALPSYLKENDYFPDLSNLIEVHQNYNRIVRDTANKNEAPLIDLEKFFNQKQNKKAFFLKDGIHFSDKGLQTAAEIIHQVILREYPAFH